MCYILSHNVPSTMLDWLRVAIKSPQTPEKIWICKVTGNSIHQIHAVACNRKRKCSSQNIRYQSPRYFFKSVLVSTLKKPHRSTPIYHPYSNYKQRTYIYSISEAFWLAHCPLPRDPFAPSARELTGLWVYPPVCPVPQRGAGPAQRP